MSVLDFDTHYIPVSLFAVGVGIILIFTITFPVLGLITIPIVIGLIGGIFTEAISYVEEPTEGRHQISEEE
tara:strand:- start:49 stop:261 length:213 start_codon:yes stop_codon:yes gene_type:complete